MNLGWTASTDNVGVVLYDVFQGDTVIGSTTTNTFDVTGLNADTVYNFSVVAKDAAENSSTQSPVVSITTLGNGSITYCTSNSTDSSGEYISNVKLGTIDNSSTAGAGYTDHTAISTELGKTAHDLMITPAWTGTVYNEAYTVWIDYNQDGDFSDQNELVFSANPTQNSLISGTFTVPDEALTGETRIRISMKYNAVATPCESFRFGEVEDYTVVITDTTTPPNTGCNGEVSAFPYSEGFENGIGMWRQSTADDINWDSNQNGTPSTGTGPSGAIAGSTYIYVEASGNGAGFPSKQAILESPCFDLSNETQVFFAFNYHMNGAADMGSIAVEVSDDNGASWNLVWSQTGSQGNQWNSANVDLSTYVGKTIQARFNRTTGATWQADIAIDAFSLTTTNQVAGKNSLSISTLTSEFTIAPNPVKGTYLTMYNFPENSFYTIKNILGKIINTGKTTNTINTSGIVSGIYVLNIVSEDGNIVSKKFIKE